MRWQRPLTVLSTLWCVTLATGFRSSLQPPESYVDDLPSDEDHNVENESPPSLASVEDEQLEKLDNFLTKLLILPWPSGISPLLYVENNPEEEEEALENNLDLDEYQQLSPVPSKRTRYYRKYPWKRQNSRYEPGNRFLCTPSKEDVYRLLVALHEARQGNRERVVNFCNRKRPAYSVFTNIRYLGK